MTAPTILAPLDGTEGAIHALPIARTLAGLTGGIVQVVHIGEPILPPSAVLAKLGLTPEQISGSVLDQASGQPSERIVALAAERGSALIVMCTHTRTDTPRGTLGSVADAVLRDASCPVVLVEPEDRHRSWLPRRILLPHDGTPTMAAALPPAADLAVRTKAELLVLHVCVPGVRPPTEPGTLLAPRYVDQPQHEWSAWAREFLARLATLGHCPAQLQPRLLVGVGDPGTEIARAAKEHDCDLIVLGWQGNLEAGHGSTVKTVIREAVCPVFALRVDR